MKNIYPIFDFTQTRRQANVWHDYLHLAQKRILSKGEVLIRVGEPVDHLYYIDQGTLRIVNTHLDGTEKIVLFLSSGNLCGETPFFIETLSYTSFICTTPAIIYAFSRACVMDRILPCNPHIMFDIFKNFGYKVRVLTEQIMTLAQDSVTVRICRYLNVSVVRDSRGLISYPNISQNDMASFMGIHRITLSKALRALEEKKIISRYNKDSVTILNEQAFCSLLGAGKGLPASCAVLPAEGQDCT